MAGGQLVSVGQVSALPYIIAGCVGWTMSANQLSIGYGLWVDS